MQLYLCSTVPAFGGPVNLAVMWIHNPRPRPRHTTHRTASSTQVQGWWQRQEAVQAAAAHHQTLIIRRSWNDDWRHWHISASEGCGKDVYWCNLLMILFILHRTSRMASVLLHHKQHMQQQHFWLVIKAYTCNDFFIDYMQT